MTGYSRDQFGAAWTDDNDDLLGHNGCDTRDDILRRDLTAITVDPASHGCTVLTGSLADPYTDTTIGFTRGDGTSTAIQIDHVVPLGDAWQTGAQQWTVQERIDLGNDPINLLAVSGPQNEKKGDADAASWLPPNKAYRCAYVARQIAVKARYALWVTQAEHDAMTTVLTGCPGQAAPTEAGGEPHAVAPSSSPSAVTTTHTSPVTTVAAPTPVTTSEEAPPVKGYVTPGAFCSTAGATGLSKTGNPERCATTATDSRLRWRAA